MVSAIEIPAALAAEVAAYPDRFQPDLPPRRLSDPPLDGPKWTVVNLIEFEYCGGETHNPVSLVCRVGEIVPSNRLPYGHLRACAVIGSGETLGSPRPGPGDRVLVIEGDPDAVGTVCEYCDETVGGRDIVIVQDGRHEMTASRWAILPPEPEAERATPYGSVAAPADLWAEITANPDRFKPDAPEGQSVLILTCSGEDHDHIGLIGPSCGPATDLDNTATGLLMVDLGEGKFGSCWASAWALVGSIDDQASPEPPTAGRILVLDDHRHFPWVIGRTGHVCDRWPAPERWLDILIDGKDGGRARVGRWAILPTDPEVEFGRDSAPRWQVGDGHGRSLYLDGRPLTMFPTAEHAALVVEAMNGPGAEIARLNTLLAERGITPEMPDLPGNLVQEYPERASVTELSDIIVGEFGGHQPSETSVHAAIRVLRQQQDQLAAQENVLQQFRLLVGIFHRHEDPRGGPIATATISAEALGELLDLIGHTGTDQEPAEQVDESTRCPACTLLDGQHDPWCPNDPIVSSRVDFDALVHPVATDG